MPHVGSLTVHVLDFQIAATRKLAQPHAARSVAVVAASISRTVMGGYIQDDWRVRPRLTMNIGLRYEMTTVLNEVEGRLTNLRNFTDALPYCGTSDPALTTLITPANPGHPGCTPGAQPYYSNPTKFNFEPRFGFAWDPR